MQNHKDVDGDGVEHDQQGRYCLGRVKVQGGTKVAEVEHLVYVGLSFVKVGRCTVPDLVPERARIIVGREDRSVMGQKLARRQEGKKRQDAPKPERLDVELQG